jgi:hypothetical protein
VKMRACHPAGRADQADLLAALHSVTRRNERFAQMKVASDYSPSVIYVHDVAGEKEITDERDNTAIRCMHRCAG